jgi:hypothetical protein
MRRHKSHFIMKKTFGQKIEAGSAFILAVKVERYKSDKNSRSNGFRSRKSKRFMVLNLTGAGRLCFRKKKN